MKIKIDVSDGKNVFFISDLHINHKNVILFDNRPFYNNGVPDLEAMSQTIIGNWNQTVNDNDIVFILGDLFFGSVNNGKKFIDKLRGHIHFIMGNHDDYKDIKQYSRFISVNDLVDLTIFDKNNGLNEHFVLCHYPILSWNRKHHKSIHLHGHTHMGLSNGEFHKNNRIFDVGCNGWNYTPVSYKEIIKLRDKIDYLITTKHH